MKRFLAVVSLIVCMSFTSFAAEYEDLEYEDMTYEDDIATLEVTDTLYINEVKTDSEYPWFIIYKGGDGNFYFSRVASTEGWTVYSNGRMQIQTTHKTSKFASKETMFQAVKTNLETQAGVGRLDVYKENVYCCNFTIGTMTAHSWVDGQESSDAGTVAPEPEPDPDPGEDEGSGVLSWVQSIYKTVKSIPETILEGVKKLFIPRENFMDAWKEEIGTKFRFIEEVKTCVESFKLIAYETDEPPVITVSLPEKYGGTMTVLDTTPIHKYMPTVRTYISAWLWLHFIWLLFKQVPSIISGEAMREDLDSNIDSVKSDHGGVRGAPHKSRR